MSESTQPRPQQTWKLTLAYDGTEFHGWQVQPGLRTVQGELQAALGRVIGESPLPQGSGRTDAGVHALAQVASFQLSAPIPPENLQRGLNRTLPASIRVLEACVMPEGFHARHSATAKSYEYRVLVDGIGSATGRKNSSMVCSPFLAPYVYACRWPLDLCLLESAAQAFVGQHDFLSFAATDPELSTRKMHSESEIALRPLPKPDFQMDPPVAPTVRTIFSSAWEQRALAESTLLVYRVRGNGFLHHMVRNLVGTLLEVGRGYRQVEEIPGILAARDRSAAGPTAPAQGLFLHSVEYDGAE